MFNATKRGRPIVIEMNRDDLISFLNQHLPETSLEVFKATDLPALLNFQSPTQPCTDEELQRLVRLIQEDLDLQAEIRRRMADFDQELDRLKEK
jgi:hypothetical protein